MRTHSELSFRGRELLVGSGRSVHFSSLCFYFYLNAMAAALMEVWMKHIKLAHNGSRDDAWLKNIAVALGKCGFISPAELDGADSKAVCKLIGDKLSSPQLAFVNCLIRQHSTKQAQAEIKNASALHVAEPLAILAKLTAPQNEPVHVEVSAVSQLDKS